MVYGAYRPFQQYISYISDKVYQLLAHDRRFSPGTPASSTTKTDHHDVAEISYRHDIASMETYSSWVNCPKEKCVYESTWRIKIKSLSLELSHVNTTIPKSFSQRLS
jgi:hypothetical protein